MSSPQLGPCPECRQPIEMSARVCPFCRRSVLVDVTVESPLADARTRYRVARAIQGLGEGIPALAAVQNRLAEGSGVVAAGVSRETAERAAQIVRENGAAAAIRKSSGMSVSAASPEPRSARGLVWIVGAIAVIAFGAGAALFMRNPEPAARRRPGRALRTMSPAQVAAAALPATVALRCGRQSGAGFFIAQDLVLTNAHVLCAGNPNLTVRFSDGREEQGTVQASDPLLDLAVVRSPGLRGAPLPVGDAGSLQLGDPLTMIGAPLGLEFTVHQCTVSNLERHDLGLALIQIDASVNPGNSGGPVVDATGRAVGVVTMKVTKGEGIGLAVPINYVHAGATPLVPAPGPDSPGFARMAALAESASDEEATKLSATGQRPGLVGATAQGNSILAHIVWPSPKIPFERHFRFALMKADQQVCALEGDVAQWQKLETAEGDSLLPARAKSWLERNGFASDLYLGIANVPFDECPGEKLGGMVDLVMENADEDASTVRFGP